MLKKIKSDLHTYKKHFLILAFLFTFTGALMLGNAVGMNHGIKNAKDYYSQRETYIDLGFKDGTKNSNDFVNYVKMKRERLNEIKESNADYGVYDFDGYGWYDKIANATR